MTQVAEKPQIIDKPSSKELQEAKPVEVLSMEDLVAKTVAATMNAILPMMQGMNQGQAPKEFSPQTSQDVRTNVTKRINAQFDDILRADQKFREKISNSPASDYVVITIPKVYKPYFGSQLPVGLNGVVITVPIDNRPHRVHKDYLAIILQKLSYEDEKIDFMRRTGSSDVREVGSRDDLGR